jgi:hypothetical protein
MRLVTVVRAALDLEVLDLVVLDLVVRAEKAEMGEKAARGLEEMASFLEQA